MIVPYAHELHGSQKRKRGPIHYILHLMIVSALGLENEGTEDHATAPRTGGPPLALTTLAGTG
jgi:hypothetical protein